jgi:hypothetical protein
MDADKITNKKLYSVAFFGIFPSDQISNGDLNKMRGINGLILKKLKYPIQKKT